MAVAIDPKAGAKARRAIIAAHEAGMHDRSPKAECRECTKEQEAFDMAKTRTTCAECGGAWDGTPSGFTKHQNTAKHQKSLMYSLVPQADATPEVVVETVVPAQANPVLKGATLAGALSTLITQKEQELARRQVDLKWREANRPEQAVEYAAAKVLPLKEEIQILRDARTAIVKSGVTALLAE